MSIDHEIVYNRREYHSIAILAQSFKSVQTPINSIDSRSQSIKDPNFREEYSRHQKTYFRKRGKSIATIATIALKNTFGEFDWH
jgi:maleate cis-trans isomerase